MSQLDFNHFAESCLMVSQLEMYIGLQPSLSCLLLYWLPAKRGVSGYGKFLLTVGIVGFIGYMSIRPAIIEILENCQQTNYQTAGMIGVVALLLLFGIPALPVFFLPSILAFKTRARRRRSVLLINVMPLPLSTIAAMLWLWTGFTKCEAATTKTADKPVS